MLANVAAALKVNFREFSWVGFYLLKGATEDHSELILGPFQGNPACTRIRVGEGVCGKAVQLKQTIIVPDVGKFPGHIYCDPDSRSEIVVPLRRGEKVIGVLDVDSDRLELFDRTDQECLEEIAGAVVQKF